MADITQQTVEALKSRYPELSNLPAPYSDDARLMERLEEAAQECNVRRWGALELEPLSFRGRGMFAYAAHKSVIDSATAKAVAAGGVPEAVKPTQSKTINDESASYAVPTPASMAAHDGAGDLRTTVYGQEFLRLRRRAGAGGANTGWHWSKGRF